MKSVTVLLATIDDVKRFVNIVNKYDFDVDLVSGRYAIDAKSIMGIFSLELQSVINLEIHSNSCDDLVSALSPFRVEE